MATLDRIIHVFCLVDDRMQAERKHHQALLYPSEVVTIGVLCACRRWPISRSMAVPAILVAITASLCPWLILPTAWWM